ncbi:MAG: CapA family protein [Chloroflexi bacterium]|nr:CapA family protein [Chloroflexota bacterium]
MHTMGIKNLLSLLFALPCTLFLAACGPLWGSPDLTIETPSPATVSGTDTLTPFHPGGYIPPPTVTAMQIPAEPVQTTVPPYLWISPAVPDNLRQFAIGSGLPLTGLSDSATVRLDVSQFSDSQSSTWIYALVVPFPTTTDGVSLTDIQNTWDGAATGPFAGRPLRMDEPTLAAFSALWGAPDAGSVRVVAADQLVDSAWAERPAWAIVPFEELEPRWKVLSVDGQSPVHNDFNSASYPLKINFNLQPAAFPLLPANRDPNKLTVLAMTGTTALVRGTADRMERYGVLYPGEEIRTVLRAADITHISNEISFMAGCPTPDPWTGSLQFCSDPRYIVLLEDVGTDVVELTGNHLVDYGPEPFLTTLDMYDQLGWLYFGGGRNLQDSFEPALVEDHSNKLAFIGCNYAGPPNDWATDTRPGSAPCDLDQLSVEIGSLRSAGYLPVMTFQYDVEYLPNPTESEQRDFLEMASAGAVIVSGSQAHEPAAMAFSGGSFIHYGLGNLFFDQMAHQMPDGSVSYDTRNVFVDRHVFYDGRYISTELLTYIIEDYARPRLMTGPERLEVLQNIFNAGGW